MSWFMRHDLSESARKRVTEAITRAEVHTSGELVVVAARRAASYWHVPLHVATAVSFLVPLYLAYFDPYPDWDEPSPLLPFYLQLIVFIVVALVLSIPEIRHFITPKKLMRRHAGNLAAAQYLASNIVATKHRTGVLIFVSLFEHYVEIIADMEVAARVQREDWQQIVNGMVPLLRKKQTPAALEHGIAQCGALLAQHFPPGKQNPNELPDEFKVLE